MSGSATTGLLAIVGGVIVGAVAMEVLNKTNPELVEKIENNVRGAADKVKDAFQGNEKVEEA